MEGDRYMVDMPGGPVEVRAGDLVMSVLAESFRTDGAFQQLMLEGVRMGDIIAIAIQMSDKGVALQSEIIRPDSDGQPGTIVDTARTGSRG